MQCTLNLKRNKTIKEYLLVKIFISLMGGGIIQVLLESGEKEFAGKNTYKRGLNINLTLL